VKAIGVGNDTVTTGPGVGNDDATMTCNVCGAAFRPRGRQTWCNDACRQAAWRRRTRAPRPALPDRPDTIYQCPSCEARYLGEQRCADCNTWCRRLGAGGACPHCDELVVVSDIIAATQFAGTSR
jgi:transcription elongation factor Elf1